MREQQLHTSTSHPLQFTSYAVLPLIVILIATFFRLYHLPMLPPGLNFDEAGNGVAALDILRGEAKLWWPIGGGKEPLWPYLIALSTFVLDNVPLALRLPAAVVGILSVAAVYPLVLVLLRGADPQSCFQARLTALLTMLGVALSSWHLHFSRLGFRAILFPLLATVGFYFLWRSLIKCQTSSKKGRVSLDLVLSALFIALAVYAYLAARLLWVVPLLFLGFHWLIIKMKRHAPGRQVSGARTTKDVRPLPILIAIFLLLFLLFLSPLIVYFIINPADLVARSTTVSIFNPAWSQGDFIGTVWRTLILTLGTFLGVAGDSNPLVNLPGQSTLPIFIAPFFVLGIVASLYRVMRATSTAPSPHLFLLCWWGVMLLPAILAPEGAPHHLRLVGTIVPTYALVAIGVTTAIIMLIRLLGKIPGNTQTGRSDQTATRIAYLLLVIYYSLFAFHTYANYFIRWPATVDFNLPFDLYAIRLADDIAHAPPNVGYVLPMDIRAGSEARHYTLDYLLADTQPPSYTYLPVDENHADTLLARAARGKDELRLIRWTADKHQEADAKEIVTYLMATNAHLVNRETFPVYDVETYTLDSKKADFNMFLPTIDRPINVTFNGLLRIDAAFMPSTVSPGDLLPVALTFAPLAQMDTDYKASLRLISPAGERVAQKDRVLLHNFHQGTSLWPPETVNEYYLLSVPSQTPPGEYVVAVVIYHPDTQVPLEADGLAEVTIGTLQVE